MPHTKRKRPILSPGAVGGTLGLIQTTVDNYMRKRSKPNSKRKTSPRLHPATSRSRTRTRTKRSKKSKTDSQLASGDSVTGLTRYSGKLKFRPVIKEISAASFYLCSCQNRILTNLNQQGVGLLGADRAAGVPNDYGAVYNGGDIGTAFLTMGVGSSTTDRILIEKAVHEHFITNSTNANIIMWIYDIVPRKDLNTTDTVIRYPQTAWYNGMVTQQATGNDTVNLFTTPYMSKLFTTNFKVVKVSKVTMAPGVLHRHVVKVKHNHWISPTDFQNTTINQSTSTVAFKGHVSVFSMAVIMSGPAHWTGDGKVGTATAGIDVITKKMYTLRSGIAGVTHTYNTNNTAATGAGNLVSVDEATNSFVTLVNT